MHEFTHGERVVPFAFGDELPGGAIAHEVGSICPEETAVWFPAERALAFADGLVRMPPNGQPGFVPDSLMGDDPELVKTRLADSVPSARPAGARAPAARTRSSVGRRRRRCPRLGRRGMTAIHTEGLSKRCGSTLALDSLDPSSRARCTASSTERHAACSTSPCSPSPPLPRRSPLSCSRARSNERVSDDRSRTRVSCASTTPSPSVSR